MTTIGQDATTPPTRTFGEERRHGQLIRLQLTTRLGLVGLATAGMWVTSVGELSTRVLLTVLVVGVYVPLAALLGWRRLTDDDRLRQGLVIALDVGTGITGVLLVPEMRVPVLFLYLMLIATETIANGRRQGVLVASLTVAAALVVDVVSGFTSATHAIGLLQFTGAALALPLLIAQLSASHRAHAEHLARLHHALASIATTPDLPGTFDAIAETAQRAVGATLVSVMVFDGDDATTMSTTSVTDADSELIRATPESVEVSASVAPRSPSELAVRSGAPVVVTDFEGDARFGRWAGVARRQGIAAMVAVPLTTGEEPIGTLNAYWDQPWTPPDEDVDLLVAYAEGAALSILRARAYERERAAAAALREAEQMKNEFTAAITHELRTPLTTVRGFVETLLLHEDRLAPEDRRRMLAVAQRNAVDLSHRISSLLEFSKLEAERVLVEPHPQPLGPVLQTTLDNCAGLLTDHELVVWVPDDVVVEVDELALDHVVSNLISNAVKYSPPQARIEVGVEVEVDDGTAIVHVADHGIGIPADEVPHVFERFYRGAERGHGRSGTGIGLAIVQRYVELGGGRIWVESTEGQGTAFRFTLPLAHNAQPQERDVVTA